MIIDLDARRAARGETEKVPHVLRWNQTEWHIDAVMSLEAAEYWAKNGITEFWFAILDASEHRAFREAGPDVDDVAELVGLSLECYGVVAGESDASTEPSPIIGEQSRPTSNGSTVLTSETSATEPTPVPSDA